MAYQVIPPRYETPVSSEPLPEDRARARMASCRMFISLILFTSVVLFAIGVADFPDFAADLDAQLLLGASVLAATTALFIPGWFAHYRIRLRKSVQARIKRQKEYDSVNTEVMGTVASTKQVNIEVCIATQRSFVKNLESSLEKIDDELTSAEEYFSDRAFFPFWDSVEAIVLDLRAFDVGLKTLKTEASNYTNLLRGLNHTFPARAIETREVPDADFQVSRLKAIVYKAQRDFQFTTIFAQRQTTKAIIRGFRNITEAITALSGELSSSLEAVTNALTQGQELQRAIETRNSDHQEFMEIAINNIQLKRPPKYFEQRDWIVRQRKQ